MKNYTITVNGNTYEVSVEESGSVQAVAAPKTSVAAPARAVQAPVAKPSGSVGSVKVEAPMAGKIISLAVGVGASVKKGDTILIMEAMKMENAIPAPQDGVIASVDVAVGDSVESGKVLATLN